MLPHPLYPTFASAYPKEEQRSRAIPDEATKVTNLPLGPGDGHKDAWLIDFGHFSKDKMDRGVFSSVVGHWSLGVGVIDLPNSR